MAKQGLNPRFNASREMSNFEDLARQVHIDRLPTWKTVKHGQQRIKTVLDVAKSKGFRSGETRSRQLKMQGTAKGHQKTQALQSNGVAGRACVLCRSQIPQRNGGKGADVHLPDRVMHRGSSGDAMGRDRRRCTSVDLPGRTNESLRSASLAAHG
jgi:hypothetical protein